MSSEFFTPDHSVVQRLDSVEHKMEKIIENQNLILEKLNKLEEQNLAALSKSTAVMQQVQKVFPNTSTTSSLIFPINSIAALQKVDEECRSDLNKYVDMVKKLISPEGVAKNFHRIIDRTLIQDINYDGVRDKESLKDNKAFNEMMFEAVKKEGYTEKEYIAEIRTTIKNYKNSFYKKACLGRKTNLL